MPVNTPNDAYTRALPKWQRCRDVIEGQDAVHKSGEKYLPKLSGQEQKDYDAYKARALFYNATGRTQDGLTGLVFRVPPQIEIPEAVQYLSEDIDSAGTPLTAFCEKTVDALLAVGRFGLLTDFTRAEGARTMAEANAIGARPSVFLYRAEDIINWRREKVGEAYKLTLVVLAETVHEAVDEFETSCIKQWRALKLVDGKYTVELWREATAGVIERHGEAVVPHMGGKTLDFIPFLIVGPTGITDEVAKPPLADLVDVNLSHYRSTADYEHGLHFTGLPTPIITGHTFGDGESLNLGSTQVTAFPNAEAEASFLEFEGKGLDSLSKRLAEKEQMMVALGARLLASDKKAAETAETASIHRAGESSVLASLANAASMALTQALAWARDWASAAGDVRVKLNTDFMPTGLSAQELDSLVKTWQSGGISHETLYDNLQRGEIAQQGVSFEDELARIAEQQPSLGTVGESGGSGEE